MRSLNATMLRRAAASLRQGLQASAAWKDVETATCKRIHSSTWMRQAAEAAPPPPPPPQGLAAVPGLIKALGFAGVLPFWIFSPAVAPELPLNLLGDNVPAAAGALQVGYGATIISFLGGVHWGLAMTSLTPLKLTGQRYVWSVLPCLAAWPTLAMPTAQAAGVQAGLLGVVYMVDKGWAKRGMLPPWYAALRLPLTVLAAAGLAMTAVGEGGPDGRRRPENGTARD